MGSGIEARRRFEVGGVHNDNPDRAAVAGGAGVFRVPRVPALQVREEGEVSGKTTRERLK